MLVYIRRYEDCQISAAIEVAMKGRGYDFKTSVVNFENQFLNNA